MVGGYDRASLRAAAACYGAAFEKTVPVSSCEAAEATKILENVYRCVNIALVNELKVLFDRMGVDIWEVHPGCAVAVISSAQEAALIRQGYEPERLGRVSSLFSLDPQYHTYQEMVAKLQSLDGAYPDLLRLVSVGQS